MKLYAKMVLLFCTVTLLQGCLISQLVESPTVSTEVKKNITARTSPLPPELPQKVPVKEPVFSVAAETTLAPAGKLLVTGFIVDRNTIEILTTGQIRDFKIITLSDPSRLVIDFPNAVSGFIKRSIQVDKLGIATARFESHPDYLRIFLDAAQWRIIPYRVEETGKSLKIIITTP